jgi:cell division protein FtsL
MSWDPLASAPVVFRPVDNSRIVREVDPRSSRDLWALVLLVGALVLALGLYAWPHYQMRQTINAAAKMQRERETLLEENRKLRLEKAALENLRRVETIARRDLGMQPPAPDRLVVVELPQRPLGTQVAAADEARRVKENRP